MYFIGVDDKSGLPVFESKVACGFPSPADDFLEETLSLDNYLVKNRVSSFFVRAQGQSMYPLIKDGDLLCVDRSVRPQSGDIILAVIEGEFTIKELVIKSNEHYLRAHNKKYSNIKIHDEMNFEVWGVVIGSISKFKRDL